MLRAVTPADDASFVITAYSTGPDRASEGRSTADAIDLTLADTAVHESEEVSDGIVLDFDDRGQVIGIEILDASSRTGNAAVLTNFSFDPPSVT